MLSVVLRRAFWALSAHLKAARRCRAGLRVIAISLPLPPGTSFPLSAEACEGRSGLQWPQGGSVAQKTSTVGLTVGLSSEVGLIGTPGVFSCLFLHS